MDLTSLQCEINHLLFLYYTSIGVLQRDYDKPGIEKSMGDLLQEISQCKERIDTYFRSGCTIPEIETEYLQTIKEAKEYKDDADSFIDALLEYAL